MHRYTDSNTTQRAFSPEASAGRTAAVLCDIEEGNREIITVRAKERGKKKFSRLYRGLSLSVRLSSWTIRSVWRRVALLPCLGPIWNEETCGHFEGFSRGTWKYFVGNRSPPPTPFSSVFLLETCRMLMMAPDARWEFVFFAAALESNTSIFFCAAGDF